MARAATDSMAIQAMLRALDRALNADHHLAMAASYLDPAADLLDLGHFEAGVYEGYATLVAAA